MFLALDEAEWAYAMCSLWNKEIGRQEFLQLLDSSAILS